MLQQLHYIFIVKPPSPLLGTELRNETKDPTTCTVVTRKRSEGYYYSCHSDDSKKARWGRVE